MSSPTTADAQAIRQQMKARINELRPLVAEFDKLVEAERAFDTEPRRPQPRQTGRRGRPAGAATGNRAAEVVRLVGERPGITVSELADEMGIGTTYLYRVCPALEREGKIRKSGTGYQPARGEVAV